MEMLPGYSWDDLQNKYPAEITIELTSDLNEDGIDDIISNAYTREIQDEDLSRLTFKFPRFGGIFALDSQTGSEIWGQYYDTPVRGLFPVGDMNSDGFTDFFANMVAVNDTWDVEVKNWDEGDVTVYSPQVIHNQFSNLIISGENGEPISGNITNLFVSDALRVNNDDDNIEDFIILEGKYHSYNDRYLMNISTYFMNGTRGKTIQTHSEIFSGIFGSFNLPALRDFWCDGVAHVLYVEHDSLILFNSSSINFLDPIYNQTGLDIDEFEIIEDLNIDGIPEILTISSDGNASVINGIDGNHLYNFMVPFSSERYDIQEIGNELDDDSTIILITINDNTNRNYYANTYSITTSTHEVLWDNTYSYEENQERPRVYSLGEDLSEDEISEIVIIYEHQPLFEISSSVRRIIIFDFISEKQLAIINSDRWVETLISIPDFDGDGKKDFAFEEGLAIYVYASQKPVALWLSPLFEFGFPFFISLAVLLLAGILILAINVKKLKFNRERLKHSKMAVIVNIITIALMTVSFVLFLFQLNIFNRTLVTGDSMTAITIVYMTTTVIWFGLLPLTAAIFNQFGPRFAYGFILLRDLFFKLSHSYKHSIFVEDLKDRKELGTIQRIKRVILPMLLSISVGFYTYNTLAPMLGYPQEFDTFGGQEFFSFMIGYNLVCILPMILTFVVFSFFISGNYMLDDAGICYYLESKKHRRPGDIEPISVWAQSIIKGIAGFSAILTFISFFQNVDLSGLYTQTGDNPIFSFIFGLFISIVMFYGTPFLTSFAYILFAVEVMDFSHENNTEKLYKIMRKHDYDTTPRTLSNLYPAENEGLDEIKKS